MSPCIPLILLVIVWSAAGPLVAAESRLRAAGQELRDEDPSAHEDDEDHDHVNHHHHHGGYAHAHADDDDADNGFMLDLVMGMVVGMRAISVPAYHRYPYDRHEQPSGPAAGDQAAALDWNGQIALLGGGDGEDLRWLGVDGRVLSPFGFGLGGQWLHYFEEVDGDRIEADLVDASLVWRGFELPSGTLDCAVGYLGFHDEFGTENGMHLGLDLTLFPLQPLVVQTGASWGGIDGSSVQRYHAAAGAAWRNASLMLGYRWTDIGRVDLDGWEARLTWWF
jgi:hypothetical protein